jgi:hypothetical protein
MKRLVKKIAKAIDGGLFNDAFRRAIVHRRLIVGFSGKGSFSRSIEALRRERNVRTDDITVDPDVPRFIGGVSGRSGTTWMTRIFRNQVADSCAILGEQGTFTLSMLRSAPYEYYQFGGPQRGREQYLEYFVGAIKRWAYKRRRMYGSGLKGLMRYIPVRAIDIAYLLLKDELAVLDDYRAIQQAFGRFYIRLFNYHAATVFGHPAPWISKEPPYGRHADTLFEMIPDARLLIMVRDGREVALSMYKRRWMPTISACMKRWAEFTEMTLNAVSRAPQERVRLVRYDDLVTDFETTLTSIFGFLQLPAPDFERMNSTPGSSIAPRSTSIRLWENEIPNDDVLWFNDTYGELNSRIGYVP